MIKTNRRKKYSVGAMVLVYWEDDGNVYMIGRILSTYRGHRNQIYMIEMEDGAVDKVYDYQIC